jgi:hypothetical protein
MLLAAASVVAVAIALLLVVESSRPAGLKTLQAASRPFSDARLPD